MTNQLSYDPLHSRGFPHSMVSDTSPLRPPHVPKEDGPYHNNGLGPLSGGLEYVFYHQANSPVFVVAI